MHGEEDRPRPRARLLDRVGRVEAVQQRHAHVEHRHVRAKLASQAHRLAAIGGLGHHLESLPFQDRLQGLPDDAVVVGEENLDRHLTPPTGR